MGCCETSKVNFLIPIPPREVIAHVGPEPVFQIRVVMCENKVVKCNKCRWDFCLYLHVVVWRTCQDGPAMLDDTKYALNNIAGRCVTQVIEFLEVLWPV